MSTDKKVIIGIALATVAILTGGVFFMSGDTSTSVASDQIVSQNGIHWHPKLAVTINGKKQEFTDSIGLGAVHQPMHTHEEDYKDGVVHMEMQGLVTKDETRLGKFFQIWGKKFDKTDKTNMLVNGKKNSDFDMYEMKDNDKIEIYF